METHCFKLHIGKAKHSIYCCHESRLKSFTNCSLVEDKIKYEMATAGFFYSEHSDRVICFYCGKSSEQWRNIDDPWQMHVFLTRKCFYLITIKGDNYTQDVYRNFQAKLFSKRTEEIYQTLESFDSGVSSKGSQSSHDDAEKKNKESSVQKIQTSDSEVIKDVEKRDELLNERSERIWKDITNILASDNSCSKDYSYEEIEKEIKVTFAAIFDKKPKTISKNFQKSHENTKKTSDSGMSSKNSSDDETRKKKEQSDQMQSEPTINSKNSHKDIEKNQQSSDEIRDLQEDLLEEFKTNSENPESSYNKKIKQPSSDITNVEIEDSETSSQCSESSYDMKKYIKEVERLESLAAISVQNPCYGDSESSCDDLEKLMEKSFVAMLKKNPQTTSLDCQTSHDDVEKEKQQSSSTVGFAKLQHSDKSSQNSENLKKPLQHTSLIKHLNETKKSFLPILEQNKKFAEVPYDKERVTKNKEQLSSINLVEALNPLSSSNTQSIYENMKKDLENAFTIMFADEDEELQEFPRSFVEKKNQEKSLNANIAESENSNTNNIPTQHSLSYNDVEKEKEQSSDVTLEVQNPQPRFQHIQNSHENMEKVIDVSKLINKNATLIEEDLNDINEDILCLICDNRKRSMYFNPCNHVVACAPCATNLNKICPVCLRRIKAMIPLHIYNV